MTNLRKITETLIHNRKKTLLVLILSSLITQSLFLVIMGGRQYNQRDQTIIFNYYKPGAENMLRGKGFVDDDGELITRFSPGYPVYLLATLSLSKINRYIGFSACQNLFRTYFDLLNVGIFFIVLH